MKKKKKNNSCKNKFVGFSMKTEMEDPIANEDKPTLFSVSHSNSIIATMLKNDYFWYVFRNELNSAKVNWKIDIEMEFKKSLSNDVEVKHVEITGHGTLNSFNDEYYSTLEKMFDDAIKKNYIKNYLKTRLTQTVIKKLDRKNNVVIK